MKKSILVSLLLITMVSSVYAYRSHSPFHEGWYMDCVGRYDSFSGDTNFVNPGGSANLNLGYASNGRFAFEGGILLDGQHTLKESFFLSDGSTYKLFNKFIFGGLVFNAKYYIGRPEKYFPYIKAGFGLYALMGDQNNGITGTGYQVGCGIERYISEKIALQLGLTDRIIKYDKAMYNGKSGTLRNGLNGNTLSIEFGISYRFGN